MNQTNFYYKAFGLVFKSCIEHPDFILQPHTLNPDCVISYGKVPKTINKPDASGGVFQSKGKRFLLRIEKVGRYLIEDGNSITIENAPDATVQETIVFLWASAIAVLLHQRGILIVHGSAINMKENAVIFSGHSGSGKSTIASSFLKRSAANLISDDISAISINNFGFPIVLPGFPVLKLWRDSSEKLGYDWNESRIIRESINKMLVDSSHCFVSNEVPLRQLYILSYKNQGPAEVQEINGYKKMDLVLGKIFRKNYIKGEILGQEALFNEALKILPQIRVCTLQRKHGITELDTTLEAIEKDLNHSGILDSGK
jgi:hypothetical protein